MNGDINMDKKTLDMFLSMTEGMPGLQMVIADKRFLKGSVTYFGDDYFLVAFDINFVPKYFSQKNINDLVKDIFTKYMNDEAAYHALKSHPNPSEVYVPYKIQVN